MDWRTWIRILIFVPLSIYFTHYALFDSEDGLLTVGYRHFGQVLLTLFMAVVPAAVLSWVAVLPLRALVAVMASFGDDVDPSVGDTGAEGSGPTGESWLSAAPAAIAADRASLDETPAHAPLEGAMAGGESGPAFKALDAIRPELEGRSGHCKSCSHMLLVIDQLELLHQSLSHEAGYQEHIDAPFNAGTFRRAVDALLEADTPLATAAGLMSFSRRD